MPIAGAVKAGMPNLPVRQCSQTRCGSVLQALEHFRQLLCVNFLGGPQVQLNPMALAAPALGDSRRQRLVVHRKPGELSRDRAAQPISPIIASVWMCTALVWSYTCEHGGTIGNIDVRCGNIHARCCRPVLEQEAAAAVVSRVRSGCSHGRIHPPLLSPAGAAVAKYCPGEVEPQLEAFACTLLSSFACQCTFYAIQQVREDSGACSAFWGAFLGMQVAVYGCWRGAGAVQIQLRCLSRRPLQ